MEFFLSQQKWSNRNCIFVMYTSVTAKEFRNLSERWKLAMEKRPVTLLSSAGKFFGEVFKCGCVYSLPRTAKRARQCVNSGLVKTMTKNCGKVFSFFFKCVGAKIKFFFGKVVGWCVLVSLKMS